MSDIPVRWNQFVEAVSDDDRRAAPGGDGMVSTRYLDWDGCFNIRDLGGLRTSDGHTTRWRAIVRADSLNRLSSAGWSKLCAYGICTIIDLRNESEIEPDAAPRPSTLTTVHVPLDDIDDTAMWQYFWDAGLDGSPLYYQPFLDRKQQRCAAALAALAHAEPGGVVIHCGIGRDRTGLISMLLLALAGAQPEEIANDYEHSNERLARFWSATGAEDQRPAIAALLARAHTTARDTLLVLLASRDLAADLRAGGLSDIERAAIQTRLLGRPGGVVL